MSLTFSCLNIKIDGKKSHKYSDKLFIFRKSQLTIAKKSKSLSEFISSKILHKLNEGFAKNHHTLCLKDNIYIYSNIELNQSLKTLSEFLEFIYKCKSNICLYLFLVDEKNYLLKNYTQEDFKLFIKTKISKDKDNKEVKKDSYLDNKEDDDNEDEEDEDEDDEDDEEDEEDDDNEEDEDEDEDEGSVSEQDEEDDDDIIDDDIDENELIEGLNVDNDDDDDEDDDDMKPSNKKAEKPQKKKRGRRPKKNKDATTTITKSSIYNLDYNLQKIEKEASLMPIKDIEPSRVSNVELLNKIIKNKNLSRKVEHSIYNYAIDKSIKNNIFPSWKNSNFCAVYINKSRNIYLNLDSNSYIKNESFLSKIKKKDFNIEKVAYLKPQEIFPELWKPIIDENIRKEEIMKACENQASTSKFQCPNRNCRARKAIYTEVQTRSADEPMTLFITCLVCGKRWKQ